jgi:hypothetical protein
MVAPVPCMVNMWETCLPHLRVGILEKTCDPLLTRKMNVALDVSGNGYMCQEVGWKASPAHSS